jgi:hypothetical protein
MTILTKLSLLLEDPSQPLWKPTDNPGSSSVQDKFIEAIKLKIRRYFDYVFAESGKIIIYIKPKGDNNWNKIEKDKPIKYKPDATITIVPVNDEIHIKVKHAIKGDKFDSKSLNWRTKIKLSDEKIIKIIADKINTLINNLDIKKDDK